MEGGRRGKWSGTNERKVKSLGGRNDHTGENLRCAMWRWMVRAVKVGNFDARSSGRFATSPSTIHLISPPSLSSSSIASPSLFLFLHLLLPHTMPTHLHLHHHAHHTHAYHPAAVAFLPPCLPLLHSPTAASHTRLVCRVHTQARIPRSFSAPVPLPAIIIAPAQPLSPSQSLPTALPRPYARFAPPIALLALLLLLLLRPPRTGKGRHNNHNHNHNRDRER